MDGPQSAPLSGQGVAAGVAAGPETLSGPQSAPRSGHGSAIAAAADPSAAPPPAATSTGPQSAPCSGQTGSLSSAEPPAAVPMDVEDQAMEVVNDDQDQEFPGASSGARAGVVASKCDLCEQTFTLWSLMTYVGADNFQFAKTPDTRLMKAVNIASGSKKKSNFADPACRVLCVCGLCLETKHGVQPGTYVTVDRSHEQRISKTKCRRRFLFG